MTNSSQQVPQLTNEQIEQHLNQVAAISENARGTWFSLILVLLFSVIAVAGVEDKDFFVFGAGLSLPVIGYAVPVASFFYAAPAIVLGLYAYLHLYLLNLWHLIGELPCELPDGRQLEDAIYPWIATNAVISIRRKEGHRPFTWLTRLVVFLLVWCAAPGALLYLWWRSVVPHDLLLTSWAGLLAGAALIGGTMSLCACFVAVSSNNISRSQRHKDLGYGIIALSFALAVFVLVAGELRSKGRYETGWIKLGFDEYLYSAQLYRVELVERPKDWLPHEEAFEKFKARYRNLTRFELLGQKGKDDWVSAAREAFLKERTSQIDSLKQRELRGIDLRKADLRQAFMAGIDLTDANLRGANLNEGVLELSELNHANLNGAKLIRAELNEVKLNGAVLDRVMLHNATMNGAELINAELNYTEFNGAELNHAELNGAKLNGAKLNGAKLNEAKLNEAKLNGAELNHAELNGADLNGVELNEAKLNEAKLNDAVLNDAKLNGTELNRAVLNGARLIDAELNGAKLNGAELNEAWLSGAELNGAELFRARLNEAKLFRAKLNGAVLKEAWLNGAKLNGAKLNNAVLNEAKLDRAELNGTELNYAELNEAKLNDAWLIRAELNGAKLNSAKLNGAKLNRAVLNEANLERAELNSTELKGAKLYRAKLDRAELNGAVLNEAVLYRTEMNDSDLANASLQFAFTRFVDLSQVRNLTQSQVNSMFAAGKISLPAGLFRPAHWAPDISPDKKAYQLNRSWRRKEVDLKNGANDRLSRPNTAASNSVLTSH